MTEKTKILVVEDESSMAKQLKWGLSDSYEVMIATDGEMARSVLKKNEPEAVLLDLGLPPEPDSAREGLLLLEEMIKTHDSIKVIVTTGNTDKSNAMRAIDLGAYDYYQKPVDIEEIKIIIKRAVHLFRLESEVRDLRTKNSKDEHFDGMIANTPVMMKLFERARKVARTGYPVLIQGSSGTGKERIAMGIHRLSDRAEKPFVIVDCGAIPENLLESELFGHEKGSFTGAHARKNGKLERAMNGTVVLDEIGELPLFLQVKLLRFLQEGTIERVGGKEVINVDARVIAVTNVDLADAVEKGAFREDLYYRLNVVPLMVPPLRQRTEDIPLLARYYLDMYSKELGPRFRGFSPTAVDAMMNHSWQGNVREMQNRVRRAVVMGEESFISPADLDLENNENDLRTLKEARDMAEFGAINRALARYDYNITKAAQVLNVSRPTLHDLIKKHKVQVRR